MDRRQVDDELRRQAASQLGLLTRRQALAAGASPRMITRRVVDRRWQGHRWRLPPWCLYAQLAPAAARRLPGGRASRGGLHRSAAVLHGLSDFRPARAEITVPRRASRRSQLGLVHESGDLEPRDLARHDGVPVTAPARTLLDLAAVVGPARLEDALDDALCRQLTTLDQLADCLARLGGKGRPGSAPLQRALSAWSGGALPQSVAEMRVVRRLLAQGLPEPVRQYEINDGGRFVGRVDLAYPDARVTVELDGFRWHATRRAFDRDRARKTETWRCWAGWCWGRPPPTSEGMAPPWGGPSPVPSPAAFRRPLPGERQPLSPRLTSSRFS